MRNEGNGFKDLTTGGNVARIYASVVPVEMAQGDNYPAQVLCVVNGSDENLNKIEGMTLEQIRDIKQPEFTRSGNFLMSNSVYYGYNSITGINDDRLCATPIS